MSSYVIGYLSLHTGELQLDIVEADNELDALVDYFDLNASAFNNLDLVYDFVADTDSFVNICEI